jgi:hypothetical protein
VIREVGSKRLTNRQRSVRDVSLPTHSLDGDHPPKTKLQFARFIEYPDIP